MDPSYKIWLESFFVLWVALPVISILVDQYKDYKEWAWRQQWTQEKPKS